MHQYIELQPHKHEIDRYIHTYMDDMKTMVGVLLISSLLVVSGSAAASRKKKEHCHSDDRAALLAIDAGLGHYFSESWTADNDTACCEWASVHCDPFTGRVDGLSVFQLPDLNGTIPDAVARLVHLRTLMLHHLPGLSGPIPPAISKLSNLSLLIVSWTNVSGAIPPSLGKLTQLTVLDLSFNALSGPIPAALGGLPYLAGINLSRNRLTGAIPPLLFSKYAGDDNFLRLSHNNLSGGVPAEFAAVDFWQIDLSRNALTGDAFNLSGVDLPGQLASMDLSHNAIYGGIPAQVANLTNLQQFNVSYNRLCGAVPSGGTMARFDAYSFQHNKCLCGNPLPSCN
ncbi:hypothetical protein EJB05_34525, partial [Eragrostis curvula]